MPDDLHSFRMDLGKPDGRLSQGTADQIIPVVIIGFVGKQVAVHELLPGDHTGFVIPQAFIDKSDDFGDDGLFEPLIVSPIVFNVPWKKGENCREDQKHQQKDHIQAKFAGNKQENQIEAHCNKNRLHEFLFYSESLGFQFLQIRQQIGLVKSFEGFHGGTFS